MQNVVPPVLSKPTKQTEIRDRMGVDLCRRVVVCPTPNGLAKDTHLVRVGGQVQAACALPVCVSRESAAAKPDYNNLDL